jgi:hypothetical protein
MSLYRVAVKNGYVSEHTYTQSQNEMIFAEVVSLREEVAELKNMISELKSVLVFNKTEK